MTASRRDRRFQEWPTLALAAACYGAWLAAGALLWPVSPSAALAAMAVCVTLHSSLQHEALHGHPTRSAALNEALVWLPLGPVYPYRRFRRLHLRHHADERLTDPFEDPESWYVAASDHARLGGFTRTLLKANNTLAGRIVLGPALSTWAFLRSEASLAARGDREALKAWGIHLPGVAAVWAICEFFFGMPFWLYLLVPCYAGMSILSVRTFAEHRWAADASHRSAIVEKSVLSPLFLNNNLHAVHHRFPRVPWFRLPALYRSRREEFAEGNGGYVFANYGEVARRHAFEAREPVVHPAIDRVT